jgi:osmotically-inducible protein OsmY
MRHEGPHRGRGPRSYRRTPERILEDLCDRLTEDPFVDASEIEVQVNGTEVVLTGTVDDWTAQRQAQSIAQDVAGVTRVTNNLRVAAHLTEPSPGGAVNAALGVRRPR